MASAGPDPWSSALPSSETDRRGTLLRLQAELFVGAPSRDRETIRVFEAIVLGFLTRVDGATLVAVARLVAPCPDTSDDVLVALAQASCETRAIVAAAAPRLPDAVVALLLGTAAGRLELAARPDLDERTLDALLAVGEGDVDAALAGNPALRPGLRAFEVLLERARTRAPVAAALLTREDLALADEAALYLQASPERRAEIRHRVAASVLFRRAQPPRLRGEEADALVALAADGDVAGFERALAAALGIAGAADWRLLEENRTELLGLALAAVGLDEEDAIRIFLTLHPAVAHSVPAVFALARLVRQVSRSTALALVAAVLGVTPAPERQGRHVPGLDASGTPARAAGLAQSDPGRAVPAERRHRAG